MWKALGRHFFGTNRNDPGHWFIGWKEITAGEVYSYYEQGYVVRLF